MAKIKKWDLKTYEVVVNGEAYFYICGLNKADAAREARTSYLETIESGERPTGFFRSIKGEKVGWLPQQIKSLKILTLSDGG